MSECWDICRKIYLDDQNKNKNKQKKKKRKGKERIVGYSFGNGNPLVIISFPGFVVNQFFRLP